MRKSLRGFLVGFISAAITLSTIAVFAATPQSISVMLNGINISVYGSKAASPGESYALSNGTSVPFSIVYQGTTYLPLRKVAELVGKDVNWDGATSTANIVEKTGATTVAPKTPIIPPNSVNSRLNPARLNQKIVVTKESWDELYTLEITMTEVIRGQEAWDIIEAENMFNSPPKAGFEYMLTKFKVKVLASKDDKPLNLYTSAFEAVSNTGTEYTESGSAVVPSKLSGDVYQGSELEGYTYSLVAPGDSPSIRYGLSYEDYAWFKP